MSKITDAEIMNGHLAEAEDLTEDVFPELSTLSPAFFFQFTPVPNAPQRPEIVFVPKGKAKDLQIGGLLATWNLMWEAAQFRRDVLHLERDRKEAPELIDWIEGLPEANIYLYAASKARYDAYAPLYHLLPKRVLDRHGIPALKRGLWPTSGMTYWKDRILTADFPRRLSNAFAEQVWPYLDSGSGTLAFRPTDSLVLLSHDLDFWLSHAVTVLENRLRQFPRVTFDNDKQRRLLAKARKEHNPDGTIDRPRVGGNLWQGEEEAREVLDEIVQTADRNGRLRAIIDTIRSNRIADDFSDRWSYAKEDFERKIYRKRAKVRVSFIELDDTLPVHSPRSEYTDNLLWQDFAALLDTKERHVIVCLRNGTTRLGDIAASLGYANHSPISKALAAIRRKAQQLLNLN